MKNKDFEAFVTVIESEKSRIAGRDKELLTTELNWIAAQPGLTIPSSPSQSLDEYCRWLSSKHHKIVKWDLLRHYASQEESPYLPVYQRNNGTVSKPHHLDYKDRLLAHSLAGEYWYQAKQDGFLSGRQAVSLSSGQVVFERAAIDGMNSMTVILIGKF